MKSRRIDIEKDFESMHKITSEFKEFANFEELGLSYNPDSLKKLIHKIDNNDNGAVFVAEKDGAVIGSIIAIVSPWFLDDSIKFVQIVGVLASLQERGVGVGDCLFEAVSKWGENMGASKILGASLQLSPNINLNNWYEKRGFSIFESHYIKEV